MPLKPGFKYSSTVTKSLCNADHCLNIGDYHNSEDTERPLCEAHYAATSGFETKDSGAREHFESGMQRDTTDGKIDYSLALDGPMFKRYAELMTRGAVKYEKRNWMKAAGEAELERFRESALRHFIQWFYGETDEDHGAAVYFNINGAEYVREKLKEGK